jgi:transcriptional regulator with XRE-family HTH domain
MQPSPQSARLRRYSSVKRRIARRITQARENAGQKKQCPISMDQLASQLQMFPKRMWEIENGLLAVDSIELAEIAGALGVHPGWFYGGGSWEEWSIISSPNKATMNLAMSIAELDHASRHMIEKLIIMMGNKKL